MARNAAVIGEAARASGLEDDGAAGSFADHMLGGGMEIRDDDIVLGALAIDQVDFHLIAFMHA